MNQTVWGVYLLIPATILVTLWVAVLIETCRGVASKRGSIGIQPLGIIVVVLLIAVFLEVCRNVP
jgi:hypothetical protein